MGLPIYITSPRYNLKSSEIHVNVKLKSYTTTTYVLNKNILIADKLSSSFCTTVKSAVFICCC